MILNTFWTPLYATSQGNKIIPRSVSLEVPKGKYIVVDYKGHNWRVSETTWPSSYGSNPNNADYKNLKCSSNNCVIRELASYWNRIRPTKDSSNLYNQLINETFTYYVEIEENSDTLISTHNDGSTNTNMSQYITIIAIPIS